MLNYSLSMYPLIAHVELLTVHVAIHSLSMLNYLIRYVYPLTGLLTVHVSTHCIQFELLAWYMHVFTHCTYLCHTCPLTGMFAICAEREYVRISCEDFMKAVRKVADMKKLEAKMVTISKSRHDSVHAC